MDCMDKNDIIDKEDVIIRLKALLLDIYGVEIYSTDENEDLRERKSFDAGCEEKLKEIVNDEFHIDVDLSTMNPLTLDTIADFIIEEKKTNQGYPGVTKLTAETIPEETETFDRVMKMMGEK